MTNRLGGGDNVGGRPTFANDVFDSADAHKVGTDQGYCVRIVVQQDVGVHVDDVPAGRPDHREARSRTPATADWRSPAARARTGRARLDGARVPARAGTKFDFVFHLSR